MAMVSRSQRLLLEAGWAAEIACVGHEARFRCPVVPDALRENGSKSITECLHMSSLSPAIAGLPVLPTSLILFPLEYAPTDPDLKAFAIESLQTWAVAARRRARMSLSVEGMPSRRSRRRGLLAELSLVVGTLIGAGVPIGDVLLVLAHQDTPDPRVNHLLRMMASHVGRGNFDCAIERHPALMGFPTVGAAISGGIQQGRLDKELLVLADALESGVDASIEERR